jgi:DNA-binding response OmpR family regulator
MTLKEKQKRTQEAIRHNRRRRAAEPTIQPFLVLVISADDHLQAMVESALHKGWSSLRARDPIEVQGALTVPHLRLVVLDDAAVQPDEREWLMTRIHRDVPFASVIYVASTHGEETERRARANGAKYYTAAPLAADSFVEVVRGFLGIHGEPDGAHAASGLTARHRAKPR